MKQEQKEDLAYKLVEYDKYREISTDSVNSVFAPYQLSVKFAVHPLSDKYRFLVNHSTGSGKTTTSLLVAKNFLNYGQRVYIITFNSGQFLKELMTVPEFGFITQLQLQTMREHPDQVETINKQINKKINKQIVFIGYKELFLSLFQGGSKLNTELLSRFRGSLIICDEVHNIYNNQTKNSYGVSIQILSYMLGKQIHMLYLSATPLNYSSQLGALLNIMQVQTLQQEQILELIDQLKTQNLFTEDSEVNKGEVFESLMDSLKQSVKVTKDNAKQLIQQIMKDRISFVPEIKKDFPESLQKGVEYQAIDNVIVKKCNISAQFKDYMMKQENYLEGKECKKNILIHPELDFTEIVEFAIRQNPQITKWLEENDMQLTQSLVHYTITGSYLKASNVGRFSPKLGFLIGELLTIQTKSFIYINKIQGFGIDLVAELLKVNGILLFDTNPTNTSICFKCKKELRQHNEDHEFVPYRAIVITGTNVSQGEDYLKRFNSIENHFQPRYHIVIGNIKMKEGYNILEVNNSYILTLPFNITNYIQVLGRCARNKSHINLPKSLQYVNNYLLMNTAEHSETLGSEAFQSLLSSQRQSKYYGRITREELDLWEKSLDFKLVQEYEQIIHSQSIDIHYFHPLYMKSKKDPKNDDLLIMQSENLLKMIPFPIHLSQQPKETFNDILIEHNKFDVENFFLMNVSSIINTSIQNRLKSLLNAQSVWELDKLVTAIRNDEKPPNLDIVPLELIKQKIFTNKNTYIVDNYVIYNDTKPQMNFFLQGFNKSPLFSVPITKQEYQPVNQQELVKLYMYLQKNFPEYVNCIVTKRIPVGRVALLSLDDSQQADIPMSREHQKDIFQHLLVIFGNTPLSAIQQQYQKMILQYNQQIPGASKGTQADFFITCLNFLLPITYESSSTQQTKPSNSQSSNTSNSKYSENKKYMNIVITGYILDLNTQIHMQITGQANPINPQRDLIFPQIVQLYQIPQKRLKMVKLRLGHNEVVKTQGMNCMSYEKDDLQDFLKKANVSKQEHCDLILRDTLLKHFQNIINFRQIYIILFNFI